MKILYLFIRNVAMSLRVRAIRINDNNTGLKVAVISIRGLLDVKSHKGVVLLNMLVACRRIRVMDMTIIGGLNLKFGLCCSCAMSPWDDCHDKQARICLMKSSES